MTIENKPAKNAPHHTSQDYDRKHGKDHIANNPRAAKDIPGAADNAKPEPSEELAEIIARGHTIPTEASKGHGHTEDKRDLARQEHTNHFTNRANQENK